MRPLAIWGMQWALSLPKTILDAPKISIMDRIHLSNSHSFGSSHHEAGVRKIATKAKCLGNSVFHCACWFFKNKSFLLFPFFFPDILSVCFFKPSFGRIKKKSHSWRRFYLQHPVNKGCHITPFSKLAELYKWNFLCKKCEFWDDNLLKALSFLLIFKSLL